MKESIFIKIGRVFYIGFMWVFTIMAVGACFIQFYLLLKLIFKL